MLARGTPWFIAVPPAAAIALASVLALRLASIDPWMVGILVILVVLSVLGLNFFRDPDREVANGLVAPAHGRVLEVNEEGDRVRVSTFMGLFDVHVVRAPLGGRVASLKRGGRGFDRADAPGAASNVRVELSFEESGEGHEVVMVSGWFARRIVPYVNVGDVMGRGDRIGLVRFGSRVDVVLPANAFRIEVAPGQRLRAAESSMGVRIDEGH
jgi:phosphatidylserine decarboxylase